jgi:respiratory burst oxidase
VGFISGALVIGLVIRNIFPHRFDHYLFLFFSLTKSSQFADVSKSEWHPFTLSSAPSDPHLTCHIKTAGDWTQAVHQKFAHLLESNQPPSEPPVPFSIYVDGPFGSPAQDYTKYPVAVFVAAGIGATPMVSVLREVSAQITKSKLKLAQTSDTKKPQSCWPHTLYFHWIVREQAAAFWFNSILQDVLEADSLAQVHIDIWFTGGGSKADMRSLVMLLAQDIAREKTGVELITGITSDRLNVHFQRPSWKMEFDELVVRHGKQDRKVGVFCCGPALLEQDLKDMCLERSSGGSGLKFVLRPERF